MAKRLCESDNTCGENMKKFKTDPDDVVHPHQTTENPSPQEEGGFISDHVDKDKSDDVVNPHQTTKNPSPQEEGGHFPRPCNHISLSGDEHEFEEDNPPIRHVEEFTDDYDLLINYFVRYPFEDKEDFDYKRLYDRRVSKEDHQTILRYIKQIRESFAFDVACYPPSWFCTPRLITIDLTAAEGTFPSKSREKAYMGFIDWLWKAAKVAVEDINYAIGFETSGKGYKFVGLEKAVTSPIGVHFLTINVIEVHEVANVIEGEGSLRKTIQEDGAAIQEDGAGVEGECEDALKKTIQEDGAGVEGEGALRKTIQAIVTRKSHLIYQVEQWRMKPFPVAEDA